MQAPLSAWMAQAYRSAVPLPPGAAPDPDAFSADVLEREAADLHALEDLGVRVLTILDDAYPERLRGDGAPLVLQVAGRTALLHDDGVTVFARYRGDEGAHLADTLDSGGRAILVLSKGMLKAGSLLKALAQPIADGSLTLISAEPPRASWGPVRDRRRDAIRRSLSAFRG